MSKIPKKHKARKKTARPIDHVVISLTDLTLARERFTALGFTVAPVAQHNFGTQNTIIAFANGTFIEPLAIGDKRKVDKHHTKGNQFLVRDRAYRFRHGGHEEDGFVGGFSMVSLSGKNANKDRKKFRKAGLRTGKIAVVKRPGLDIRAIFALDDRAPDCTIFACERKEGRPEFGGKLTSHRNGALKIARIVMVDENPEEFRQYLSSICQRSQISRKKGGLEIKLSNGLLCVLTPEQLKSEYGTKLPQSPCRQGLRQVTYDIGVSSLDNTAMMLAEAGIKARQVGKRIVVANAPGQGAMLAFVENKQKA